jgi:hypothetical protein
MLLKFTASTLYLCHSAVKTVPYRYRILLSTSGPYICSGVSGTRAQGERDFAVHALHPLPQPLQYSHQYVPIPDLIPVLRIHELY